MIDTVTEDSLWDKLWGYASEEDRRGPCPLGVPTISFIKRQKLTGVDAGVHERASTILMADEKEKSTVSQQYSGSACTRGLPHSSEKEWAISAHNNRWPS